MLDLSTIRFAVDTSALDQAVTKIGALGNAMQGLVNSTGKLDNATAEANKTQAEANLINAKAATEATKTATALEKKTKATTDTTDASKAATEASKAQANAEVALGDSIERTSKVADRQESILSFMTEGYSRGQAATLALAKAQGDAAVEIERTKRALESIKSIQGTDPFDKSLGAEQLWGNELKVLTTKDTLFRQGLGLTQKQLDDLGREYVRMTEKYKVQGKALDGLSAEFAKVVAVASEVAQANNRIKDSMQAEEAAINKAAQANNYLERELQKVRTALDATNSELSRGTVNSVIRFENALKSSGKTLAEQTVLLKEYRDAQITLQKTTASRNMDYITRAVAPQITDIVVGLATGQSPLTVMMQQGGQLRDQMALAGVAGKDMETVMTNAMLSMGTSIKNTASAIGGMFVNAFVKAGASVVDFIGTVTGLNSITKAANQNFAELAIAAEISGSTLTSAYAGALMGISKALRGITVALAATGIGAAIIALVSLGIAFKQVTQENDELARTLQLSGGALAMTHSTAIQYIDALTNLGATTGEATQAMVAMAKAGNITKDEFLMVGASATEMSKWAGVSIDEVVKKYSELKKEPVKAILELAQATGMVSPELIRNIQALAQQGEGLKAGELAMKSYRDITESMLSGMKTNYSAFGKFLIELKDGVAQFFSDTFKSVMLVDDPVKVAEGKLLGLQKRIAAMSKQEIDVNTGGIRRIGSDSASLIALQQEASALQEVIALSKKSAAADEARQQRQTESAKAVAAVEQLRLREQGPQQKALEEKTRLEGQLKVWDDAKLINEKERAVVLQAIQHQQDIIDRKTKTATASLEMPHSNEISIMEKEYTLMSNIKNKTLTNDLKMAKASLDSGLTTREDYMQKEISILNDAYDKEDEFAQESVNKRALLYKDEVEKLEKYKAARLAANVGLKESDKANAKVIEEVRTQIDNAARSMGLFNEKVIERRELAKDQIETKQAESLKYFAGNLEKTRLAVVSYNEANKVRLALQQDAITSQDAVRWASPEQAAIINAQSEAIKHYTEQLKVMRKEESEAERAVALASVFGADSQQAKVANDRLVKAQEAVAQVIADKTQNINQVRIDAEMKYYKDKFKEVADVISGAITESLFNGGASGAKMLRDYLIKILKQKITLDIEVSLVKPAMDYAAGILGIPGSDAKGTTGGGILGSVFGTANTASSISSVGSLYNKAAGYFGMDAIGTSAMTQGSVAAATETASLYGGVGAAAEGGSLMAGAASAGPYALAAVAAYELLKGNGLFGGNGGYVQNRGEGNLQGDATGKGTFLETGRFGNAPQSTVDLLQGLQSTYVDTLKSLGGTINSTHFGYGSNDSEGGKFNIAGGSGGVNYWSGEQLTSDAAMKNAAAQAVFAALQGSELPHYLSGVFEGLNASTMTQAQIDAVLTYAKGIKTLHTTLESMPWVGLHDLSLEATKGLIDLSGGLDKLLANLGTFYQNFYTQGEQTTRSTALLVKAFSDLGIVMPAVDANMRLWYRAEVERTMALDQSVPANQQAVVSILGLQGAVNSLAPAFDATTTAATAVVSATQQRTDAVNAAYTALQNSVTAEKNRIAVIEKATQTNLTALKAQETTLNSTISSLTSFFNLLKTNVDQLYNQVPDTASSNFNTARAFITSSVNTATSTGVLPDTQAMADAITTVRTGLDSKIYATAQDAARDRLVLANELNQMKDVTGTQLSVQQQQLNALKDLILQDEQLLIQLQAQKDDLDSMLAAYRTQIDALLNINTSVLTIPSAISALEKTLSGLVNVLNPKATSSGLSSSAIGATSTASSAPASILDQVSAYGAANTTPGGGDPYFFMAGYNDYATKVQAWSNLATLSGTDVSTMVDGSGHGLAYWAEAQRQYDAGLSPTTTSIQGFASGGSYGGGIAMVGEDGPELINFSQPGQVYNANQTQNLLGSLGNNTELVAELQALRSEVSMLRSEARATAISTSKLNANWERSIVPTTTGDALLTKVAT